MLVGGSVRDMLLGRQLHDYDFAVLGDASATERLARATANALNGAFYIMDAARGTCRVIVESVVLDFAAVRGTSFEDDARSRDFTINAIGLPLHDLEPANLQWPVHNAQLFDPLHGARDLEQGIVRMCSPTSISDDPIRALRAVRMVTTLNAMFVKGTLEAARAVTLDYGRTSPERVRDEFFKTLALPNPRPSLRRLHSLGLLAQIVPEAAPFVDDVALDDDTLAEPPIDAAHVAALKAHLATPTGEGRTRREALNFALLCLPARDPSLAARRARFLRLTGAEVKRIRTILNMLPKLKLIDAATATLQHAQLIYAFMRDAGDCAPEVAWVAWVMAHAHVHVEAGCATGLMTAYYERYAPSVAPEPLITGDDLLALGVAPGSELGMLLDRARCAQMIGLFSARAEALEFVRSAIQSSNVRDHS